MRYRVLATDYDGTLAEGGRVDPATIAALRRLRASGRRLILVTGRELDDLLRVFPEIGLCDEVVAENGALLYQPATQMVTTLAAPPPDAFVAALRARGVAPLSVGRVIVATHAAYAAEVDAAIGALDLPLQPILNKDALMVLPVGIAKGAGLRAALARLGLAPAQTVAVGDAENDLDLLRGCGLAVAVANALPALQAAADWVTTGARGAGVVELIDRLLAAEP